jgi:hypothetical protein
VEDQLLVVVEEVVRSGLEVLRRTRRIETA